MNNDKSEIKGLLNPPPLEMYHSGGVRRVFEVLNDYSPVVPGDITTYTTKHLDMEGNLLRRSTDYNIFLGVLNSGDLIPGYIPFPGQEKQSVHVDLAYVYAKGKETAFAPQYFRDTLRLQMDKYTGPGHRAVTEQRDYDPGVNDIHIPHKGVFESHLATEQEMIELCNLIAESKFSQYTSKDLSSRNAREHLEKLSATLLESMNVVHYLSEAKSNVDPITINEELSESFQAIISKSLRKV